MVLLEFIDGRTEKVNWDESWKLQEVNPESWETLKTDLKTMYQQVVAKLDSISTWGGDEIGDGLAMLIHTAYHLGAIRQIIRTIQ